MSDNPGAFLNEMNNDFLCCSWEVFCFRIKKFFDAVTSDTKPEVVRVWAVQEPDIVENNELGTDLLSHTAYIVMVMNCPRLKN